jgi:hypothetical protein
MFSKMPGQAPRTRETTGIGGGARCEHVVVVRVHLIEEGEVAGDVRRAGRAAPPVRDTPRIARAVQDTSARSAT